MSDTNQVVARCPKCNSDDIREKNIAVAKLPVLEWELNDDGDLHPADYDSDVDVDWEVDDVANQYVCHGCKKWEGRLDQLIVNADRSQANRRHYWLVMRYACDRCGHRIDFYLEDGCEGPRDRQAPVPREWEHMRASAPAEVRSRMPSTVPQTRSGRYVLPVPFIAAGCPKCQVRKPWSADGGVLQHVDWHDEPRVDTTEPPADAGRFHYPADWAAAQACGEPVLPGEMTG